MLTSRRENRIVVEFFGDALVEILHQIRQFIGGDGVQLKNEFNFLKINKNLDLMNFIRRIFHRFYNVLDQKEWQIFGEIFGESFTRSFAFGAQGANSRILFN